MTAPMLRRLTQFTASATAAAFLFATSPAAAADFQIDGLRLDFGGLAILAPRIEVKGSPLEREAFVALFNTSTGESAVSRMGKLTAAEISAPELTFEQTIGPQKQVTSYRDVRFVDVRNGMVGRGEAARATLSVTGAATGPMSGELRRTSFEAFDVTHVARVLTERAQPGAAETMKPLFGRFEQDGYTLDMGQAGRMSMGRMSGRGFAAKVGDEPLGEVLTRLIALSDEAERGSRAPDARPSGLKTEDERKLGLAVLSLYDQISYGSGEMRDLAMTITAPPKPGAKPETVEMTMARIAFGEDAPAKSGFAVEGLSFSGGGGKGKIDSISHHGFSAGPMIAELKALLARPDADPDAIDFRKLIPTIGTLRMAGLSVDAPQEARRGQPAPPPLKIGLGAMELTAGEQLNGLPTAISLTIDNLVAPVTPGTGNPAARDLLAMGYRALDMSARLDLAWDGARNEIAIRALSLGGAGMARLDAKGTLGNVTKDLFASDLALAQVAALGATARSLEATLQNQGLFEKLIENEARKAKRKPDEMRQQFSMMANLGLAAILGPSDAAKTLTAAISRFVARPGKLSLQATAKSSSGLGLADVITLSDPTEILDKIDLKASSE
jgi:hypothetical protein